MLHIPDELSACLKETLSKEQSTSTLEQQLPHIRHVLLKLLQGFKRKQSLLRERFEPSLSANSRLLARAQQRHLSPLRTLSTTVMPLPSPSTSTEYMTAVSGQHNIPTITTSQSIPQTPVSPEATAVANAAMKEEGLADEVDMNDPSTRNAMMFLSLQSNLARRSLVRRTSQQKVDRNSRSSTTFTDEEEADDDSSSMKEKALKIYLKKGDRIKRTFITPESINLERIKELFQRTFPNDPVMFDDQDGNKHAIISILDPESNVEYELDDLKDIKPYSILSMKDNTASTTVTKNIVEATVQEMLQKLNICTDVNNENGNNPSATPTIPKNHQQWVEQQKEIEVLRHELAHMKLTYHDLKKETDQIIKKLKGQNNKISAQQQQPTIVMNLDEKQRAEMNETREVTQKAATLITNRLERLQDTIDQLKADVTQRRCRPSKQQLRYCQEESGKLKQEMDVLKNKIQTFKPVWKKTWEVELQQIVKEQQFLKEQEGLLVDLNDDHKALNEVLEQLMKISEIHERKKQFTDYSFISKNSEEQQGGMKGMTSVMKEVSTIHVDHTRRLKALEHAEKQRAKELAQRIDAFERELTDFVGLRKLKKTGGAEAIDKRRQEKDNLIRKQIFAQQRQLSASSISSGMGVVNSDETPPAPSVTTEEPQQLQMDQNQDRVTFDSSPITNAQRETDDDDIDEENFVEAEEHLPEA
ncbi:actin interacting protein 3-domain-containing protein [Mycotypha africana]|uniref:actin interacting protein 3-domain-containing protein n=1 Tax=Mycotypha africana TaxID=64632 RepID=UPI0023009CD1|nr:actin interacting protein 3-domain-containing protein [Mycotypha africana]KAI8967399.1 actin interacting protein 3-domain-containing protein [Mycotypha africana]